MRRTIVSHATLASALEIPKTSSAFKEHIVRHHLSGESGLDALLSEAGLTPYDREKELPKMAELLAQKAAVNGEMVIAGAVVVLSHATADDVFTEACGLAIELAPQNWTSELNAKRTITLGELREKGFDGVLARELNRLRPQLSARSLPNRANTLFRHIPVIQNKMYKPADPEYFRVSRLEEIDALRHDIVHRNGLSQVSLQQSADAMRFLHEAATTALRSLGAAYNIPLVKEILLMGKEH
jgi:hypothetical protein